MDTGSAGCPWVGRNNSKNTHVIHFELDCNMSKGFNVDLYLAPGPFST